MSTSTTAAVTSFLLSLNLHLDESGNVDWDKSEELVKAAVDSAALESKTVREDVLRVLNKFSGEFVNEGIVLDKCAQAAARRKAVAEQALDESYTADEHDYSPSELAEIRGKIQGFIDSNKPQEGDTSASSLLMSVRGRNGGLQTRENGEAIVAKNEAKKNKKLSTDIG